MRVEQIGDATLYLGDCQEILPTITCDHIISDPPYEDELHNALGRIRRNDGRTMPDNFGFSGINQTRDEAAKLCIAASRGWLLFFTLAEGVRAWRDAIQAGKAKYDTCLAWVKPDASPRFNGQGAARGFECIVTAWCGTGYRAWNGGGKRGVFSYCCNTEREGVHPTEKPLRLMRELVSLYTQPSQTICDPFAGSGTTGVACIREGRRFVGIEIHEPYFDIACRRIEQAQRQPDMLIAAHAS